MYEITTEITFEAAHLVPGHPKCGNLHGHTFKMVVCIRGTGLGKDFPFVIDFGLVKAWMNEVAPDHHYINDVYSFPPTSENLARYFYERLTDKVNAYAYAHRGQQIGLAWVEVWEGLKHRARYFEDISIGGKAPTLVLPTDGTRS